MLFLRPFVGPNTRCLAHRVLQLQKTIRFSTSARIMAQEFQLKGVTTLDLKDGEKREVEVEGVEDGKVLLVQMGNKTHAIGANCTHYGAPLKNGVLTPDGRLTCPWHGGTLSGGYDLQCGC